MFVFTYICYWLWTKNRNNLMSFFTYFHIITCLYPHNTQWKIFIGNSPNGDLQSFNWKRSLPACFATEKGSSWAKHEVGCELTSAARECSRQMSVLRGSVALWGCSRQANWVFNKLWQPQLGELPWENLPLSVVWDFTVDYCNLLTFTVDYCNLLTHIRNGFLAEF